MSRENVIGQRYGLLTITKDLPDVMDGVGRWRRMVLCECECGKRVDKKLIALRFQAKHYTPSCGCNRKGRPSPNLKHGMTLTKEYKSWRAMIQRCTNPNAINYQQYGGRGIAVCKRWRDSFEEFYKDMGPMPEGKRISIERRNSDGDYCKRNCQWATPREQANNRRSNRLIEGKTLAQHAREHNIHPDLVGQRLARGWDLQKALTEPPQQKTREIEGKTIAQHAREHGIPAALVSRRLRDGWDLQKALTTPPNKGRDNSYRIDGKTLSQHAREHGMPPETVCTRVNRDGWDLDEALNVPVGGGRKARIQYLKSKT